MNRSYGPVPNGTLHVHLWWPPRARVRKGHETIECPIPHFSVQKGARKRPLCALDPHFCQACTGASSAADFYPTVKAALHHESVDSDKDRKGLGCHLGQGLWAIKLQSGLASVATLWTNQLIIAKNDREIILLHRMTFRAFFFFWWRTIKPLTANQNPFCFEGLKLLYTTMDTNIDIVLGVNRPKEDRKVVMDLWSTRTKKWTELRSRWVLTFSGNASYSPARTEGSDLLLSFLAASP